MKPAEELAELYKSYPNKYIVDFSFILDFFKSLGDTVLKLIAEFFQPVAVSGHLVDLLVQQLVMFCFVFFILVIILFLMVIFFILTTILRFQDIIINNFQNKYINLYILTKNFRG